MRCLKLEEDYSDLTAHSDIYTLRITQCCKCLTIPKHESNILLQITKLMYLNEKELFMNWVFSLYVLCGSCWF